MQHQTIVLFDALHNLTVNFKAMQKDSGPNDAAMATLRVLSEVRQMGHTILCMDMPPYARTKVYPEYKARRDREPEFGHIVKWFLERAIKDGYHVAQCAGAESDDAMATLARQFVERGCKDVRIVSEDKDLTQCLVHPGVRIFVYRGKGEWEVRDADYVRKRYSADEGRAVVEPKDMALYLALVGDASDSVPGINGIGGVTAAKFIHHYKNPAGIAVALSAAVEAAKQPGAKPLASIWKKYAEGMADLPRWLQLTRLHDDVHVVPGIEALLRVKEIRPLVEVDESDPEPGSDLDEPDWDAVAEEALAFERREMAAALPVEPAPIQAGNRSLTPEPERDPAERRAAMAAEGDKLFGGNTAALVEKPKPIIGADPNAGAILTQMAEERAARNMGPTRAGKQIEDAIAKGAAAAGAEAYGFKPASSAEGSTAGADPKAAPAAPAASSDSAPSQDTAAAGSSRPSPSQDSPSAPAEVVPRTRGPRKADDLGETVAAITPFQAPSWALSTQPASAGQTFAIAKSIFNSRLYAGKFDNPESIAVIILRGRELGLGMITALDSFHSIKGKACVSSQLIRALVDTRSDHEYTMVVEATERRAVVEIKHKKQPKPVQWSYTIEEAEALGLLKPSPKTGEPSQWVKRPKTMLLKTAAANGHRFMFPGATLGLHALETEVDAQHLVGDGD